MDQEACRFRRVKGAVLDVFLQVTHANDVIAFFIIPTWSSQDKHDVRGIEGIDERCKRVKDQRNGKCQLNFGTNHF